MVFFDQIFTLLFNNVIGLIIQALLGVFLGNGNGTTT
jgi:hypothetical protein